MVKRNAQLIKILEKSKIERSRSTIRAINKIQTVEYYKEQ